MTSDKKRLDQVYEHIARIKISDYPAIVGNSFAGGGGYRIEERPFQELPEPAKLAILQESIDWSGISNRDQATILLSEIDPGKITDAQRSRLIAAAADKRTDIRITLRDALFADSTPPPQPDRTSERGRTR